MGDMRSSPLALTVLGILMYEPQHVYGVQQLIQQWGKHLVVNVGQRTSLYRTIERLAADGLVKVQGTERNQAYPERTVYKITGKGRTVACEWLTEMLAVPRQEFPSFPAALSLLLMLPAGEVAGILERRLDAVTKQVHDLQTRVTDQTEGGLDRVGLLEFEYLHAMARAEAAWLRTIIKDLSNKRLTW